MKRESLVRTIPSLVLLTAYVLLAPTLIVKTTELLLGYSVDNIQSDDAASPPMRY